MKHPVVTDFKFELGMDCPINTRTLRGIFEAMGVTYDPETKKFSSDKDWVVRIEDQHENEEKPHYILQVGDGEPECLSMKAYCVAYCDFHSTYIETRVPVPSFGTEPPKYERIPNIHHDPGQWRIFIWLPKSKLEREGNTIAHLINEAYEQAMIDTLPDYEILTSDLIPSDLMPYEP